MQHGATARPLGHANELRLAAAMSPMRPGAWFAPSAVADMRDMIGPTLEGSDA